MSIKLMSAIWENGPEDRGELLVLLALADFANDKGECWPSVESVAEKARMDERSARRIIRKLEASGWLLVSVGGGRKGCSNYTIKGDRMPPRTECPPGQIEQKGGQNEPKRGTPVSPEPSLTIKNHQSDARVQRFDEFWAVYPHRGGTKKGRKPAFDKYRVAVKRGIPEQAIIDGAKRSVSDPTVKGGFARDPATWLHQEGWTDEIPASPATPQAKGQSDRDAKMARYDRIARQQGAA